MTVRAFPVTHGVVPDWDGISSSGLVVARFLATVRISGDAAEAALVMAPVVLAHQVSSSAAETIPRTPEDYAAHIRDQHRRLGPFRFEVTELLEAGDRVFVRWTQAGHHLVARDGSPGTARPITDVGSAVYRVEDARIAEYWIQLDAAGMERQLDALEAPS